MLLVLQVQIPSIWTACSLSPQALAFVAFCHVEYNGAWVVRLGYVHVTIKNNLKVPGITLT